MSQWADYNEPEIGDQFVPKDNIGHFVVVKPYAIKTGIITTQSPNGTDAVQCDLVDLHAPGGPATYHDSRLFGGAFVDAMRPYLNKIVAVRIEKRQSKSGREYCYPAAVDAAMTQRAREWVDQNNPFAPPVATVAADAWPAQGGISAPAGTSAPTVAPPVAPPPPAGDPWAQPAQAPFADQPPF